MAEEKNNSENIPPEENNNDDDLDFGEFPFDLPKEEETITVKLAIYVDGEFPVAAGIKVPAKQAAKFKTILASRLLTEMAFLAGTEDKCSIFDPEKPFLQMEECAGKIERLRLMGLA